MHDTLSGRAVELAHLVDLIRASLALADSAIPPIHEQLAELSELGLDNFEFEGPQIFSRTAGSSPAFDECAEACGQTPLAIIGLKQLRGRPCVNRSMRAQCACLRMLCASGELSSPASSRSRSSVRGAFR